MRALASALAALALLAGCGHHQPQPAPHTTTSSLDTPAAVTTSRYPIPTAPPTNVVTFPTPAEPDPGTRAAYLADLDLADPDIVHGQPDQAVARGIAQCATFLQFPDDPDRQIGIAHERFTSPGHPNGFPLGDTKYILQTVHKHLCPDYPAPEDTGDRPEH